jgi:hypothetical protein
MKTRMHQAISEVTDTMTSLAQKTRHIIRDYALDNPDGAPDSLEDYVKNAKAYPDTLATDWTDRNDVTYDVVYVGTNPMFWVVVSGLSEEMCLSLSNGNYGNSNSSGFVGLTYKSSQSECSKTTSCYDAPVSLATAVTGCTPEAALGLSNT